MAVCVCVCVQLKFLKGDYDIEQTAILNRDLKGR